MYFKLTNVTWMTEMEGIRDLVGENAGNPFQTVIRNTFSYTASYRPMWVSVWLQLGSAQQNEQKGSLSSAQMNLGTDHLFNDSETYNDLVKR